MQKRSFSIFQTTHFLNKETLTLSENFKKKKNKNKKILSSVIPQEFHIQYHLKLSNQLRNTSKSEHIPKKHSKYLHYNL